MFPTRTPCWASWPSLLHACGDVSMVWSSATRTAMFAPRMWRCFWLVSLGLHNQKVCSTHVEMFPEGNPQGDDRLRLLHACGDVSTFTTVEEFMNEFAPRMWRCFSCRLWQQSFWCVCSTHVEMFPTSQPLDSTTRSLLHACGDVSLPIS